MLLFGASIVLLEAFLGVQLACGAHLTDETSSTRGLKHAGRPRSSRRSVLNETSLRSRALPDFNPLYSTTQLTAQNVPWTTTPFNPPGIPLAVRSPYISTWLWGGERKIASCQISLRQYVLTDSLTRTFLCCICSGNNDRGGELSTQFSSFWNGNTLPWCGVIQVDGQTYTWMGISSNCGGTQALQKSLTFTATQTVFVMSTGSVDVSIATHSVNILRRFS